MSSVDGLQITSIVARRGAADEVVERLRVRLGIAAPRGPRRAWADGVALLGVGPNRWLAIADAGFPSLSASLALDLTGLASVCDQGDGYVVFSIEGFAARDVLARGVPIDLHPAAFGLESVGVTQVAHMGAILWQTASAYHIAVLRSHRASFWRWLMESAAEPLAS